MPSEPLHAAFEALRARLQSELDAQLASFETTIDARHREALEQATRASVAPLGDDRPAQLDTASAEADPGLAPDAPRLDAQPATGLDDPARERRAAAVLARLPGALRTIGQATSLTAALDALADAAAAEAPHCALFLVSRADDTLAGGTLERWRSTGFGGRDDQPDAGPLADLFRSRLPVRDATRDGLVVPILVGGQVVAIVHAEGEAPSSWVDALIVLGQHASACLSVLTSTRVSQVLAVATAAGAPPEDEGSARRYARLLVSEIKLYNESAVRTGRERRDLLARLRPEIDRARRLYEERVPGSFGDRAHLFQQELVQTLAAGDPTLLGAPA